MEWMVGDMHRTGLMNRNLWTATQQQQQTCTLEYEKKQVSWKEGKSEIFQWFSCFNIYTYIFHAYI
jgi:hypothetical protein